MNATRPRARDIGIRIGHLPTGPLNAIVDVPGVCVGHVSLIQGNGALIPGKGPVRTGVTAILPHRENLYTRKVCAAVHVINAFGKSVGLPQIEELGNIETPILLTGTLNVWTAANALVDFVAGQNPGIFSFNPVVGECNDSFINDALGRHVGKQHVFEALTSASDTNVEEGNVGAGVGMSGFGWKAGIGTASRQIDIDAKIYTLGALVLTNTGSPRELRIDGVPIGDELTPQTQVRIDGSIIMVIATNAPLSSRQLGRITRRAAFGLARTGATASHGSGDFAIGFTTGNIIDALGNQSASPDAFIPEPHLSAFFSAAIEATEEAIVNSILKADTLTGRDGHTRFAIPIDPLIALMEKYNRGQSSM